MRSMFFIINYTFDDFNLMLSCLFYVLLNTILIHKTTTM